MALTVNTTVLPLGNRWVVLFSLAVVLLIAIVTGYFFYDDDIPQLVLACVIASVAGLLLALDVQLLMTARAFSIGPENVVFGAITVYVDWVNVLRYGSSVCCGGKEGLLWAI